MSHPDGAGETPASDFPLVDPLDSQILFPKTFHAVRRGKIL